MSVHFTGNVIRKGVALVLVGTIVGGVSYGQVAFARNGNICASRSDFLKGYYSDEDVKKNREELMSGIEYGGNVKTYEKKRDMVPKAIKR